MIKYLLTIFLTAISLGAATPHLTTQFDTNYNVVFPANGRLKQTNDILEAQGKLGGKVYGNGVTTPMELTNIITRQFKDVAMFGLNGDGTTDWTTTLNNAIVTNMNAGETLAFLSGTNVLDGVTIDKNLNIYIAPNATILYDTPATNLFQFTANWHGKIYGGGRILTTGSTTNNVSNNHAPIAFIGSGGSASLNFGEITDITFEGFPKAAIANLSSRHQNLNIHHNRFIAGYQLPTTALMANAAIIQAGVLTNGGIVELIVAHNIFTNETRSARLPGGVYWAGSDTYNFYVNATIIHNKFYNAGDDHAIGSAHYGIATIDGYEDGKAPTIFDNYIEGSYYYGIKAQNMSYPNISHNWIQTSGNVGIGLTTGERSQTNSYPGGNISYNTIFGNGTSTYAINVNPGDNGTNVTGINIVGNFGTNVYRGVNLSGYNTNGIIGNFNDITIAFNKMYSTNNNAYQQYGIKGNVDYIYNIGLNQGSGSGITMTETNNFSKVRIIGGDYTGASRGGLLWGIGDLTVIGARFTGPEAIEIKQDAAGNLLTNFVWSATTKTSGTVDFTYADFVTANIELQDGKKTYISSATTDHELMRADGTTPIISYHTAQGLISVGPVPSFVSGVLLGVKYDTNTLTTPFVVRNDTAAGAVGISVASAGASGGIYAWDDTYTTTYRTNRITLLANSNTEGLQGEYPVGGDFEFHETSTLHAAIGSYGLKLREQSAPSTPVSGFSYYYTKTDGFPYFKNDSGVEYPLIGGGGLFYNVRLYGAIPGDGIDDTVDIQETLDAAGENQIIVFPEGYYQTTNSLKFRNGQKLWGLNSSGQFNTSDTNQVTIHLTSTTNSVFEPYNTSADTVNVEFNSLYIRGNTTNAAGINMYRVSYSKVIDCLIAYNDIGVILDANTSNQAYFNEFRNGKIAYNVTSNVRLQNGANANRWFNTWFGGADRSVESLSGSSNNEFHGAHFQGVAAPDETDEHIYSDSTSLALSGGWLEACNYGIYETANGNVSVFGTTIGGNVTNIARLNPNAQEGIKFFRRPNAAGTDVGVFAQIGSMVMTNFPTTSANAMYFNLLGRNSTNSLSYNWGYDSSTTAANNRSVFYSGTTTNAYIDHQTGSFVGNNAASKLTLYTADITQGTDNPVGTRTGTIGDIHIQTDGGVGTTVFIKQSDSGGTGGWFGIGTQTNYAGIALGDLTTTITTGNTKGMWIAPRDGTIVELVGGLLTASASGGVTIDLNNNGGTILSTKMIIDATEATSVTSATNYVISTPNFSKGDVMTMDIDTAGTTAVGPQFQILWIPR
jgi:hypothetical protein